MKTHTLSRSLVGALALIASRAQADDCEAPGRARAALQTIVQAMEAEGLERDRLTAEGKRQAALAALMAGMLACRAQIGSPAKLPERLRPVAAIFYALQILGVPLTPDPVDLALARQRTSWRETVDRLNRLPRLRNRVELARRP